MFPNKIPYAPRWIIFFLDLLIVAFSILFSFSLRLNFNFVELSHYPLLTICAITILVNAGLFFAFRVYSGIIRYTTVEEARRILMMNIVACILFAIIEHFDFFPNGHPRLFPKSVILIYFFCASFLLIVYRFAFKSAFHYLFSMRKKSVKAAIYNAGYEGMLAKKMINDNKRSLIRIVAFLDDDTSLTNKTIENIPVLEATEMAINRLLREDLDLLIIADPFIRQDKLNQLVDLCIDKNITIQQVPPSEKWFDNKIDLGQLQDIDIEQLLDRPVINIQNRAINEDIEGKKILVTGAAGSIGSEIVRQLLVYKPAVVILCDIAETPLHELSLSFPEEAPVKVFLGDICDRVRMEQIFEIYEPQIVYHAAAFKHVPMMEAHPTEAVINNIAGTQNLAELSVHYGVEKFIMISTDKAVNPTNVMGASKRVAEIYTQSFYEYLRNHHQSGKPVTKLITTRFGNVLGSSGSVIPLFKEQIAKGGPVTVTHPEITRYFMTIHEACNLVLEASVMGNGGEIFVFDMGNPIRIADLARKMIKLSGKVPGKDIEIRFTGLRPGEKLYEELLNRAESVLPTYHEKIMIAKVRHYDYLTIKKETDALIKSAQLHIVSDTVQKMKQIVPEYISNNSIFSRYDINKPSQGN